MSNESKNGEFINQSVVGDEDLVQEDVVEEAVVAIADEEQIKQMLGLTVAMVYLLDICSDTDNRPLFDIQHIPFTADVIQELTQFKVQLYFIVIDRTNSFISLKDSQQFCEYVSALDEIWSNFENKSDEQTESQSYELSDVLQEMTFHEKKFHQFLDQICCAQRAIELICSDSEKQLTDFGDIFGADILQRSLRKVNDFYTEIADRLSTRVDRLKQLTTFETKD